MSKVKSYLLDYWVFNVSLILSVLALAAFIWFKIASIPNGYNTSEWQIHNNLIEKLYSFSYFWHHVVYIPYYILFVIPQSLNHYGLFSIRSIGAFYGVLSVMIFFYISWRWWGNLIAVLSSLLFASSFWFLQVSRNSGPVILYIFAALIIILMGFVVRNKKEHETRTLLSALFALVLLYIPGIIWFVLAACILQRKLILEEFRKLPTQVKFIIPLAGLILILPLIHACYTDINTLKTIAGLPLVFSYHSFLKNLLEWPLIIFFRNPVINSFSIGHLPILSIFIDIMFALGIYWIWLKRKLDRFYLLGATIILSWILYSLGGPVSIYLSLPFIMCIATTGIAFLLSQWFTVFPRNPVARSIGITVLVLAVVVVSWYNINEYFVAWPHSLNTIAVYSTHKR